MSGNQMMVVVGKAIVCVYVCDGKAIARWVNQRQSNVQQYSTYSILFDFTLAFAILHSQKRKNGTGKIPTYLINGKKKFQPEFKMFTYFVVKRTCVDKIFPLWLFPFFLRFFFLLHQHSYHKINTKKKAKNNARLRKQHQKIKEIKQLNAFFSNRRNMCVCLCVCMSIC